MTMMPDVGTLIGKGESGYVFDVEGRPDQVIKIVEIRPGDELGNPFRFVKCFPEVVCEVKIARNELQANLFARLVNVDFNAYLPKIYDFGIQQGGQDLHSKIYESYQKYDWDASDWNSMVTEFGGSNRAAWWVMEKYPTWCITIGAEICLRSQFQVGVLVNTHSTIPKNRLLTKI